MNVNYENNKHTLKLSLTNKGNDFSCYSADLPWSHPQSMLIVIGRKDAKLSGLLLSQQLLCDTGRLATITLTKDQTIGGEIDLENRFPELIQFLKSDGVDAFWSYELTDLHHNSSNRLGGWLYLPKM